MRDTTLKRMVRVSEEGTREQRSEDRKGASHAGIMGKSKEHMEGPK